MGAWDKPPTKEELDKAFSAPPTPQELGQEEEESGIEPFLSGAKTVHSAITNPVNAIQSLVQKIATSSPDQREAFIRSAAEEGGLGFSGEAAGVTGALGMSPKEQALMSVAGPLTSLVAPILGVKALARNSKTPFVEDYRQKRDEADFRRQELDEKEPGASFAGKALGVGGTVLAPVGSAGTLAKTLATGTGIGATQALGTSKADLTKGEFEDAGADMLSGGGAGFAGGALGAGLGKLASYVTSNDKAALRAFAAAHPQLRDLKIYPEKKQIEIGKRLLNEELVKLGGTTEGIAARAGKAHQQSGKIIGDIMDELVTKAESQGKIALNRQALTDLVAAKLNAKGQLSKKAKDILLNEMDDMLLQFNKGENTFDIKTLHQMKSHLQELGRFDTAVPSATSKEYQNVSHGVRDALLQAADEVDPQLRMALEQNFKRHSELAPARDIATEAALKDANRTFLPMYDFAALAAGSVMGGPAGGVPAMALAHLLRTRGQSTAAVTMNELSKLIGPEAAEQLLRKLGSKGLSQVEVTDE